MQDKGGKKIIAYPELLENYERERATLRRLLDGTPFSNPNSGTITT